MFSLFLKFTFRAMWHARTYSLLNIFGLSVGIACATLIFLWVEDEQHYDTGNVKYDRLYQVYEHQAYEGKIATFSANTDPLAAAMKTEIPGVKEVCRCGWPTNMLFASPVKSIYSVGYYADPSYFTMFTIPFAAGNSGTAFEQLHSLVISEKMAGMFYGSAANAIGKTLKVDNTDPYTITGVMKNMPGNSTLQGDWLMPYAVFAQKNASWLTDWGNNSIGIFAELDPNADVAEINRQLKGFIQLRYPPAPARPFLLPMCDWRLRNQFENGVQTGGAALFVHLFSIIAWVILLIACINFMNLATARSERRAKEVGVYKVLGANKAQLIRRFMGEAVCNTVLAIIVALILVALFMPAFNALTEKSLVIGMWQPAHLLALCLLLAVCSIVAGAYPAFYLSSLRPAVALKNMKLKDSSAALIRKGLVMLQFTVSIVLIIATIIIYQQVVHVQERDYGYDKSRILFTGANGNVIPHFDAIREQLLATGYVTDAALSNGSILYMGSQTDDISWEGKNPAQQFLVAEDDITPGYLATIGLQLKYGQNFTGNPAIDTNSIIINETLAKMMKVENPVGEQVYKGSRKGYYTITGVVKDFIFGSPYDHSSPLTFFNGLMARNSLYIRIKKEANQKAALAAIGQVLKMQNPEYPFDYSFLQDQFNGDLKSELLIGRLSRVFAALAILISCIGLFGLSAYTAERRTKEIGIRKVLGAGTGTIAILLSKEFLQLVLLAIIIAFPIAWWAMHSWLQQYAYHITIVWWVFAIAGLLAMLIAIATISFQSVGAAKSNPVKNLRSE